jgi:hypothetical protein
MATRTGGRPQSNLPPDRSASASKVLSALDTYYPVMDLRPDEDGVIDLTTPVNDVLFETALRAQLTGCRTPSAHS